MSKSMPLTMHFSLHKIKDKAFTGICLTMCLIVLTALGSILYTLLRRGLHDFGFHLFTQMTPGAGQSGGLANAIFGSIVITLIGVIISVPIGILIATYLSEERKSSFFAKTVRLLNDTLLSAPSIIIGLFVYTLMVQTMGHFSALAGAVALGLIALPMIIRSTEDVLTSASQTAKGSSCLFRAAPLAYYHIHYLSCCTYGYFYSRITFRCPHAGRNSSFTLYHTE